MGLILGCIQSLPIMFDVVFTAVTLFTLLYVLTRVTIRLAPRFSRFEYRVILVLALISVPLVFSSAGRSLSALMYYFQPFNYGMAAIIVSHAAVAMWASVAAVLTLRLFKECWRIDRWVKRLPAADDPVFHQARKTVPAGRNVVLKASGPDGVVASWGLWRRVVLVPEGFVDEYSEEERRLMYLHELSRLRRRDSWMLFITAALRNVGWFTPAGLRALARIQEGMEIACDRAVLACDDVSRICYAELILRAQAKQASLAPGFAGRRKTEVRARIETIVDAGSGTARRFRDGGVFLAFTVLLAGTFAVGYGIDREYRRELENSALHADMSHPRVVTMPDGSKARHSVILAWRGSFGSYALGRAVRIQDDADEGTVQ
ncbi:MAG: M56 family metallopeptidase [Planctomycetaceae bacterium]|nr:M56 family metallopeptidase [Planctomycetaceae bacterium]